MLSSSLHLEIAWRRTSDDIIICNDTFPLLFGFQAAAEFSCDYAGSLEQEIDQKYSFRVGYAW